MAETHEGANAAPAAAGAAEDTRRKVVKVTVNLPSESVDALRDLAGRHGDTMTAALRDAIEVFDYLDEAAKDGAKILLQRPSGEVVEVVYPRWGKPRGRTRDLLRASL